MSKEPTLTYNIGVEATLAVINGKWKAIILCHLKRQSMRNGEFLKVIPNITQKVLTQQLRELEHDEIIHREVFPEIPPRVEYCLTDYGKTLANLTNEMCHWGERHIERQRKAGQKINLLDTQSPFYQKAL